MARSTSKPHRPMSWHWYVLHRSLAFAVLSRSSQSITVLESDIKGSEARREYEILDVIEFSSKRKRMSIVIRCPDGKILLLCKGADSVVVPRLQQAALASRKSQEVRRSVQIERDLRRSAGNTPRTSFGGRPSLTIRRRSSMDIRPSPKQQSLDVPTFRRSEKSLRPPLDRRNTDDRFAFLNEVSTTDDSLVFSRCFKHLDDFATTGLTKPFSSHRGRYLKRTIRRGRRCTKMQPPH